MCLYILLYVLPEYIICHSGSTNIASRQGVFFVELIESLYYFQVLPTVLSLVSYHITFMSIKMFTITMVALMQLSIDVIMDVPFKMDITLLQGCVFFFFNVSLKIEFVLI